MLYPGDEAFTETVRLLFGAIEPKPPYQALTEWVAKQGVSALNAVYELRRNDRPTLTVVVEHEADVDRFAGGEPAKREACDRVTERFREILAEQRNSRIVTENLRVVISAFAPIARIQANHCVSREAATQFQLDLADPTIWLVQPHWSHLRVFYTTDAERVAAERAGAAENIKELYRAVVEPFDDYGYVREQPITPVFDSRERFERLYRGNWQAYDRDNP